VTFGFGQQQTAGNRCADDFTVPAGKTWTLSDTSWYAYQTNSTTTSTITGASVRIWSGPVAGVNLVAGDITTNRLTSTLFSNIYRCNTNPLEVFRPVMINTLDLSWVPALPAGQYWIDVAMTGTLASGPWVPPVSPAPAVGNAAQSVAAAAFATLVDGTLAVELPFRLNGTELTGTLTYCTAKTTSNGCIPAIGSTGAASATAGSGFVVNATQMINNKSCLLFYGANGQGSNPFQGGFLCVAPAIRRTPGTNTLGNPPPNDCSGVPQIDMNLFAVGGLGGSPQPFLTVVGSVVNCQWWGRDPGFPAPNNTQLSNGLEYVVGP
jgi:hypothetical protein